MSKWLIKSISAKTSEISEALGVSEVVAAIIVNRGIRTYEEARVFLKPNLDALPSPFEITGLSDAIDILLAHIEKNSRIAVYGDYDVDGVMSAVILQKCLGALEADYMYYVPHRETEGYGLNSNAVLELREAGVSLIIACDNGISALDEAELMGELGIDLIVIDHHEPVKNKSGEDVLPRAKAIVNPKMSSCTYTFSLMCAAGLCYRLAVGLAQKTEKALPLDELLVFASIATVCDIVDLLGDNRVIVKNGIELIYETNNYGLRALLEIYNLKKISAYHFGFILGPAINASGRLESAKTATRLFLAENPEEAATIAQKLYEMNLSRREMTESAFSRCYEYLSNEAKIDKICVIYDEHIHESVAGIVAGRLKDAFHRPVIVITNSSGCAKGSARSIESYNIYEALAEFSHLFIKFGGHSQAAGFSLLKENVESLRCGLNERCKLVDDGFIKKIRIDLRLPLEMATRQLCCSLMGLEPLGKGNREPVFAEKEVVFSKFELIGKKKNVAKLWLRDYKLITAICFNECERLLDVLYEKSGVKSAESLSNVSEFKLDIVFTLAVDEYRGGNYIQLILKDFR